MTALEYLHTQRKRELLRLSLHRRFRKKLSSREKDALMALQQEVSKKINKGFVGQKMTVIIDGYLPEDDVYVARSYREMLQMLTAMYLLH